MTDGVAGYPLCLKGLTVTPAIVADYATGSDDPSEIERFDPASPRIPYRWDVTHG